jgi:hypothetical protein
MVSATKAAATRNCFGIISLPLTVIAFMFSPIFIGPIAITFALGSYFHKENKKLVVAAIIWAILLTCIGILFCLPGLFVCLFGE